MKTFLSRLENLPSFVQKGLGCPSNSFYFICETKDRLYCIETEGNRSLFVFDKNAKRLKWTVGAADYCSEISIKLSVLKCLDRICEK